MLSYLAIFFDFSLIGMLQNQAIVAQVVEDNEKVYPAFPANQPFLNSPGKSNITSII
jgi:hypothetical protein